MCVFCEYNCNFTFYYLYCLLSWIQKSGYVHWIVLNITLLLIIKFEQLFRNYYIETHTYYILLYTVYLLLQQIVYKNVSSIFRKITKYSKIYIQMFYLYSYIAFKKLFRKNMPFVSREFISALLYLITNDILAEIAFLIHLFLLFFVVFVVTSISIFFSQINIFSF